MCMVTVSRFHTRDSPRINIHDFSSEGRDSMSSQLQYRGYVGSIETSTQDKCLFGKLLFIRALVSYEGKTMAELKAAFREAVDDYLQTCPQLG